MATVDTQPRAGRQQPQPALRLAATSGADQPAHGFSLLTVIPLLRDEFPMPAEDRVGRDNRGQFAQSFSAEDLRFDRQDPPLIVGQKDPLLPQFLEQDLNLGVLKLDHLLLTFVDPAAQRDKQQLPRWEADIHKSPDGESG